jgi:hypothetical protein
LANWLIGRLADWLDATGAQHYREHAAQIREWRNGAR